MKRISNWEEIQVNEIGGNIKLAPNVYALKIVNAVDYADDSKPYLELEFDILSKEFGEDVYHFFSKNKNHPAGKMRLYYSEKAMPMFKSRIVAIEKSNNGYSFEKSNFDEKTLIGKFVIGIYREKEFVGKDGSVGTSVRCEELRSVETYKDEKEKEKMIEKAHKLITLEDQKIERPKYDVAPKFEDKPITAADVEDDDLPF